MSPKVKLGLKFKPENFIKEGFFFNTLKISKLLKMLKVIVAF